MKVFISHSTKDKWAARRISDDLMKLGIQTFLDERDISTGAPIDESIQSHLSDCDDFLILLSPDSVKSDWVLIELGGAIALKKRLVPVLLYVGVNEIPRPITKHLARDINDIDRYYQEVSQLLEGATVPKTVLSPPRRIRRRAPQRSFKVGDRVKIAETPQADRPDRGAHAAINWSDAMDKFCGKESTVASVDSDGTLRLDIDNGEYWWAFEWLTLVRPS